MEDGVVTECFFPQTANISLALPYSAIRELKRARSVRRTTTKKKVAGEMENRRYNHQKGL